MPIITTDKLGLNADTANPKPVRHVDWCGNPMKEGDSYWGKSEPQPKPVETATPRRDKRIAKKLRRKAERESGSAWTPERRAEYGAKMKAWWQAKQQKNQQQQQGET